MAEPRTPSPASRPSRAPLSDPGEAGAFDRILVTASAGSGKTFQLSSRMVALLAAGAEPESILASTFTRKAAGEILERVLLRMARAALSEKEAKELAASLPAGAPADRTTREGFEALLLQTVNGLHRIQVQTLDAFVNRAVRAFALELGLPASWDMADDPRNARLRARAVEEVLRRADPGALLALLRLVQMGGARRAVHQGLLQVVEGVHALYRESDPGALDDLWGFPGGPGRWGTMEASPEARWAHHARAVARGFEAQDQLRPLKGHWLTARTRTLEAVGAGDVRALVDLTLWKNALEPGADPPQFSRTPICPTLLDALEALAAEIPALEGPAWQARMEALGRIVPDYDRRLAELRRAEGLFDFDDLVHALAGAGALGRSDELYYRLDGRIRHLLLDEFQDTSVLQWAALRPLVDELLSGYQGERAFFVVADPKQSIYGWRGGEPRLLDELHARYTLASATLARSWRSSPVVLDFVNAAFQSLDRNPVLSASEDAGVAAGWMEGFSRHVAAKESLKGHVRLVSGPDPGVEAGEDPAPAALRRDALLQEVAREVRDLHLAAPGRTIGVLTRKNATAARLMARLRELGVEASEEGGVPVVDSAPVLAVLALLRVADHPGDGASAYLVAHSPLGPAVGLHLPTDLRQVEGVGGRVRARLLAEGYGPVVRELAGVLRPTSTPRDARRLDQLVELAFAHEGGASLRPADFVRSVEKARREDAGAAAVRIMTIHRSKGLEFDAVFLPELDGAGAGGTPEALGWRETPGGPIRRILPALPAGLAAHFPELAPALAQRRDAELRDWLSGLYVALTRARQAVYAWVVPDGKTPSRARSWARLLREAPGLREGAGFRPEAFDGKGRLLPAATLFEDGDPAWYRGRDPAEAATPNPSDPGARTPLPRIVLAPSPRRRLLPRRTPSGLEGGDRVPLAQLLERRPVGALDRGTLVHAWLEAVEWLDPDAPPTRESLLARGRSLAPSFQGLEGLVDRFLRWLEAPEVRRPLLRSAWPEGTGVARELPFVVRTPSGILQGVADRVLRVPAVGSEPPRLVVVDWKTDRVADGPDGTLGLRVERYRPQVEAYLEALASLEALRKRPVPALEGVLVFLEAGRALTVASRGGGVVEGAGAAGGAEDAPEGADSGGAGGPGGLRGPGSAPGG